MRLKDRMVANSRVISLIIKCNQPPTHQRLADEHGAGQSDLRGSNTARRHANSHGAGRGHNSPRSRCEQHHHVQLTFKR